MGDKSVNCLQNFSHIFPHATVSHLKRHTIFHRKTRTHKHINDLKRIGSVENGTDLSISRCYTGHEIVNTVNNIFKKR